MTQSEVFSTKITLGEQDFEIRLTQDLTDVAIGDLVIDVVGNVYRLRRVERVLANTESLVPSVSYSVVANRPVLSALERAVQGMYTKSQLGKKPVLIKFGEQETFFQQPDGLRS